MISYKIQTKDHLSLHVQKWNEMENPKGTLCIIHGLGEHQNRYTHVAKFYANNGFQVYSYDQRGHGKSEGKRGHTPGLQYNLDDMEHVLKSLPNQRLFLYGHSFGGNVLINFLLRKKPTYIRGAILSSTWLRLVRKPNYLELSIAKLMLKIMPSFTQNNKLSSLDLSSDRQVRLEYDNDPLTHNQISLRLFLDFYPAGKWALKNADKLYVKTLMIHGADDPLVCKSGTEQFAQKNRKYIEYKIFEDTKHEPHNDTRQADVFEYTLAWLEKNLNVVK
jgi:acylglycerol lipase